MRAGKPKVDATAELLKCRQSYGSFFLQMNRDFKYVKYQQEIIVPGLEGLEAGKYDRLMLLMEPGHAKTKLCTAGFGPWLLGRRPDREILIISYGDKPAAEFGETVRNELKNPLFKLIFPWCQIRAGAASKTYFQTTAGGKIYAVGWTGAIARIRADFILIDDPHKNWDEATSERTIETIERTFKSVVKDRLKPGGKILICTNRWAPRDLVGRVLSEEGVLAA